MSERRDLKRFPVRLKIWCEGDDFTLRVETNNLSRTGLFVRTAHPAPIGARLRISIDELGVVAQTEVRWSHHQVGDVRSGMGLVILSFESGRANYERHVDQCVSRSGEHRLGPLPEVRRSSRPPPGAVG
jgi:hypothetical protein